MNLLLTRHSAHSLSDRAKQPMSTGDPLGAVLGAVWALGSLTCIALLSLLVHDNSAQHALSSGPIASSPDLVSPDAAAAQQH